MGNCHQSRLGKLKMQIPLAEIPDYLTATHFIILPITTSHAIAKADPEPSTRDPFDRLLLSQCQVEGLQLATVDRALIGHRLSLRI
jgi:PIN domain nuclease of toxin-antitoxin system